MRRMRGFTLIELVVTMVVLAIVVAFAIPNFNTMVRDSRSTTLGDDLIAAINYARAEAVKRGGRVSLCASSNGTACIGNWTDGWIVFTDGATSDTAALAVTTVLRNWEAPNVNASITVTQNGADTNFFRFTGVGALARAGNVVISSKIEGCTGDSARTITVNRGGVARATNADCDDE
ncbi:GspH/FimT family pseudopilin [Marinimicrobium sp. ABcell2]|uniref:GspH/FimT family pseudopilin n=1 Tax=Marinimicrobium sp. ABcell2 TaxID=3069751 RepID=UPI0027B451C6|nr:GspH/FimT family pseudopilin [Marinimicrobium sp. ABcell2]MDQ2078124.1 GspH/FimT family pseudopilin [Marinimicrobium sp. ABcell2]